jgi:hypothetical protein
MTSDAVKKNNIFPIEVALESDVGPEKATAYKLTKVGMLLEVHAGSYSPHKQIQMKWQLPHLPNVEKEMTNTLQTPGIVVKTYNQHKGSKMQYLIEVHFKNLDATVKKVIEEFLDKYEMVLIKNQEGLKK